jgi:protein-disulfide isomerase
MKKYIFFIVGCSVIGAVISSMLTYQHFFPYSDFFVTACGSGLDNPCAILSRSGYGVLFGLPLSAYGLIGYLVLIVAAVLALTAGNSWHVPCLAFQLPVAAASIITDIILGSILVYLKLSCGLCVATYVVNIVIGITMFVWYLSIKEEGIGLRPLFRDFLLFARDFHNRTAAVAFLFIILFMVLFVFFASAYLEVRGSASEVSAAELGRFEKHYHAIQEEEISLPDSIMFLGDPSAKIRIIVFTDFLCTACMKFYETEKFLMERFPGKIRVDYYSFPLDTVCNSHIPKTVYSNSCVAAQAFSAAARRGIFSDFLGHHYGHYRENLSRFRSGDVAAGFKDYFKEPSLYAAFMQEVLSDTVKRSVRDDVELGGELKVRAVPTLFIDGKRLEGVPEAKLLEYVLSREIKEKR